MAKNSDTPTADEYDGRHRRDPNLIPTKSTRHPAWVKPERVMGQPYAPKHAAREDNGR